LGGVRCGLGGGSKKRERGCIGRVRAETSFHPRCFRLEWDRGVLKALAHLFRSFLQPETSHFEINSRLKHRAARHESGNCPIQCRNVRYKAASACDEFLDCRDGCLGRLVGSNGAAGCHEALEPPGKRQPRFDGPSKCAQFQVRMRIEESGQKKGAGEFIDRSSGERQGPRSQCHAPGSESLNAIATPPNTGVVK